MRNARKGAYYFNSPYEKLVRVEDPVSEFVEKTVFIWVNSASADGMLALEPWDNYLQFFVRRKLQKRCTRLRG